MGSITPVGPKETAEVVKPESTYKRTPEGETRAQMWAKMKDVIKSTAGTGPSLTTNYGTSILLDSDKQISAMHSEVEELEEVKDELRDKLVNVNLKLYNAQVRRDESRLLTEEADQLSDTRAREYCQKQILPLWNKADADYSASYKDKLEYKDQILSADKRTVELKTRIGANAFLSQVEDKCHSINPLERKELSPVEKEEIKSQIGILSKKASSLSKQLEVKSGQLLKEFTEKGDVQVKELEQKEAELEKDLGLLKAKLAVDSLAAPQVRSERIF